ncbi:MAG: hypothetical protein BJ554DRAFT_6794 [Olpidium bornovanus]|uniref:Uncharacterized protein n=1 Tax=Olpidium bornovanus TaxID=278681 RepID=A0A8H7ZXA1_9FUNG|nr:MAG: hypothetical protein BJ554DRAFT_6794 [Olpidium bornovanus]
MSQMAADWKAAGTSELDSRDAHRTRDPPGGSATLQGGNASSANRSSRLGSYADGAAKAPIVAKRYSRNRRDRLRRTAV